MEPAEGDPGLDPQQQAEDTGTHGPVHKVDHGHLQGLTRMELSGGEKMAMSVGGAPVYGTSGTGLGWPLWHPTTGPLPC